MEQQAKPSAGRRILFLDSLRAIAVLLVVWGHVMLVGIDDPATVHHWVSTVSGPIFGPDSSAKNFHGQLGLAVALATGINPGGLGVALFFLISGFVIIRSVERVTAGQFLVQRFFRIVPTCMAAVLFVAAVTWGLSVFAGFDQPHTFRSILASSVAMNFYNATFPTIPVLWTLEVEISFYLLVAVLAAIPGAITSNRLMATCAGCLLFVAVIASPAVLAFDASALRILQHWSTIAVHISFMLVGSLIYRAYLEGGTVRSIVLVAVSLAGYWLGLKILLSATNGTSIGASLADCVAALIIFIAGLLTGMRARWLAPLRWIGDISYPLYLLHVPLGWMLLAGLAAVGFGMNGAGLVGIAIVILLSWIVHKLIELPTQRLGKRLAKRFGSQNGHETAIITPPAVVG